MRLLAFLALTGCAARVTVHHVQRGFDADVRALRPVLPDSSDFRPLRAHGEAPMARTIELGERFLEERERGGIDRDYVAAMLACAYLPRGRVAEARALARKLVVPGPNAPERERGFIERTRWLASACHALEGRLAVDAMAARGSGLVEFLETYGDMAGYKLPRPEAKDYLAVLERYATDLHAVLFAPEPLSPLQLEARTRRLREIRRILAELVANDAAALMQAMRPADVRDATTGDMWFSMSLSSLYVSLSYLSDDLVPRVPMIEAQKQWLREQALSTYEAARALARHYLDEKRMAELETGLLPRGTATPRACRERLYARLFIAQKEVLAWITIRGE